MVNKKDQEEINKGLNLLAKTSLIVFVGILLSKIFTYAYRIILARYYGPEVYGLFSLALMVVGFFVAFATLGLTEGLSRFIPMNLAKKEYNKVNFLINFSKKVIFFSSIISGILLFFFSSYISISIFKEPSLIIFLKILAFLLPIQLFSNLYLSVIRANEKITAFSFGFNILQNFVKFALILVFIFFSVQAIQAVAFSYFLGIVATTIFVYFYCKFKLPEIVVKKTIKKNSKKTAIKDFLSYSWPLVVFGIIGSILFWVDTFTIGFFKETYLVGIYNAAIPIAALMAFSGELFIQLFFPMVTRELSQKNFVVAKELSKQLSKWIFLINLPFLVLLLLFPGVFINILWGQEYLLAENALRFLAIGMFCFSLAAISSVLLSAKGKSKIILTNFIIIASINLLLNFSLVPKYGINGAAFATMSSLILWSIILILEGAFIIKIVPFRRKMLEGTISLLIASAILFYVKSFVAINSITLILLGSLFVLTYILLIFITKSFDKNDWKIIKSVYRKIKKK